MTDFLNSLKSDLLDRRFLPVLALLGVALLAALAYAVLGGSSSSTRSTPPTPIASSGATGAAGVAVVTVTPAPAVDKAVSETTSGAHHHSGAPRNPFAPLPGANTKPATASSSSSAKTSSGSSGASSSTGSSGKSTSSAGGTTPKTTTTPKPSAPAKPRVFIHFHVSAQFGVVPTAAEGAPPQPAQLKTYADMPLDEPLPDKANPQLVYVGVVLRTGKEAVFALTGADFLHGPAVCKPSATQCQAIELRAGQSERLEVVEANGQTVAYELKLLSIAKTLSATASAAHAHTASKAGRVLLRRAGLAALPGLGFSTEKGKGRSGK